MAEKYQVIYDMGNGMVIAKIHINDLMEQNINARVMTADCFNQLASNIKKRKSLESLPFCALSPEGRVEIVSGHHRVRAARQAGISEIIILLDVSGLTRSQIIAKQLAHNSLVGKDDDNVLKELFEMMDNIDDKIESFINVEELELNMVDVKSINLSDNLDFKTITFLFTGGSVDKLNILIDRIEKESPSEILIASKEAFQKLVDVIAKAKKKYKIKNSALAIEKILDEFLK